MSGRPLARVTGGARRIGAAICRELARRGMCVAVHFHRNAADADILCRELRDAGTEAFAVGGDLSTDAGCRDVFGRVREWGGRVDVLVNNAAVFHRDGEGDPRPLDLDAPLRLLELLAAQAVTENDSPLAAVHLLDARIARPPVPPFLDYTRAKASLADSIPRHARELAPRVRVNGVAPGSVLPPEGLRERAAPRLLPGRPTPADVARAVAFLLESPTLTGQILWVDAGEHLLVP